MTDEPHYRPADAWDHENGFYLTSGVARMGKMLNQYELYKRIVGLPGEVVEVGVYKGASMARLLTYRDVLETRSSRRVLGFDAFGLFPRDGVSSTGDRAFIERFELEGGDGFSRTEIDGYLAAKGFGNYELIAGDVRETMPHQLSERPQLRVSLLHLDLDVYEPTADVLRLLEDRLVPGAMIVVDDYGAVDGATKAVDEFCGRHGLTIEKLSLSHVPAFVRWAPPTAESVRGTTSS